MLARFRHAFYSEQRNTDLFILVRGRAAQADDRKQLASIDRLLLDTRTVHRCGMYPTVVRILFSEKMYVRTYVRTYYGDVLLVADVCRFVGRCPSRKMNVDTFNSLRCYCG